MTDDELIRLLKSTNRFQKNKGFTFLVNRDFEWVKQFVLKNSGTEEDAKDTFQEGLIVLMKNIERGVFEGRSSLKSYLNSICKNIWLQSLRKLKKREEAIATEEWEDESEEKTEDIEMKHEKVKQKFKVLGKACQDILIQFYYERKSMKELQEIYQLSSPQVAKNKKSRCLKKLAILINE